MDDTEEATIHEHRYDQTYGDMGRRDEWKGRESYWKDRVYYERCTYRFAYQEGSGAPHGSCAPHHNVRCGMIAHKDGLCHYHAKLLKDAQKNLESAAKWLEDAKGDLKRAEKRFGEALKLAEKAQTELKR